VEYPVACYAGSAFKQNLHPEGAKFRNTQQLAAVIGILNIFVSLFVLRVKNNLSIFIEYEISTSFFLRD